MSPSLGWGLILFLPVVGTAALVVGSVLRSLHRQRQAQVVAAFGLMTLLSCMALSFFRIPVPPSGQARTIAVVVTLVLNTAVSLFMLIRRDRIAAWVGDLPWYRNMPDRPSVLTGFRAGIVASALWLLVGQALAVATLTGML